MVLQTSYFRPLVYVHSISHEPIQTMTLNSTDIVCGSPYENTKDFAGRFCNISKKRLLSAVVEYGGLWIACWPQSPYFCRTPAKSVKVYTFAIRYCCSCSGRFCHCEQNRSIHWKLRSCVAVWLFGYLPTDIGWAGSRGLACFVWLSWILEFK